MGGDVAAKTDLQPAPSGILDFSKFLAGTKTSGSEAASGTQSVQGQTGPLEAIIAQLSDPNNLSNLVSNLFAKGAQQVPGLTAQYANATGTRTSNNAMLGQSLAQLNQSLASSIAESVVKQQTVAADASAKLAEVNKTTASTKAANTTTVQKPNDLKTGVGAAAGTVLAGTLLNQLAKKFNIGGADKTADSASTVPALPSEVSTSNFYTTPGDVPVVGFGDAAPLADQGLPPLSGADLEPIDIPLIGDAGVDTGLGVDVAPDPSVDATAPDPSVDVSPDVDPGIEPDVGPEDLSFWDDMEGFFANGGIVLAHSGSMKGKRGGSSGSGTGGKAKASKNSYADGGEIDGIKNYADGGIVDSSITAPLRRNIPNYGPRPQTQSTAALNIQPSITPVTASAAAAAPASRSLSSRKAVPQVDSTGSPDSSTGNEGVPAATTNEVPSIGPMSIANAALGLAKATSLSAALGPIGLTFGLGVLARNIALSLSGNNEGVDTSLGQAVEISREFSGPEQGAEQSDEAAAEAANQDSAESADSSMDGTPEADSGDAGADSGYGGGSGSGDDGNDGFSDSSSDGSDGGGDDGGGDGGGEFDGGVQNADSIKEASGIDKKTIHVTPGEYVLPVDVTQALGVDMLDELVAHLHTPIGTKNITKSVAKGRN